MKKILKISGTKNSDFLHLPIINPVKDEASSALVMLGFAAAASQKAVDQILKNEPELRVEQVIKAALKLM